jgi:glycosyltransferase involved in cell wall biosynthesis
MVSVVIPAHNAVRYLPDTLKSVQSQTHTNLEILVIDDGSTDETADLVTAAARRDPRIRLHRQAQSGVAAARNSGVRLARSEWVAPVDADDLWYPEKIQKQLAVFERGSSSLGLVYSWTRIIDEGGKPLQEVGENCEGDVFIDLVVGSLVGHGSGALIRRSCFREVGCYGTEFFANHAQGCEDWDLYLRIGLKFDFAVVPEYQVGYRMVPQSMSRQYETMDRSFRLMRSNLKRQVPDLPRSLLSWSEHLFYSRLSIRSRASGLNGYALRCWLRSCVLCPVKLLEITTYRFMLGAMLGKTPRRRKAAALPGRSEGAVPKRLQDAYGRWVIEKARSWWGANPNRRMTSVAHATFCLADEKGP